jgi:hypothetical protein
LHVATVGSEQHRTYAKQTSHDQPRGVHPLRQQAANSTEQGDQREGSQTRLSARLTLALQAEQQTNAETGQKLGGNSDRLGVEPRWVRQR